MRKLKNYLDSLCESGIPYIDVLAHIEGKPLCRETVGQGAVGEESLFIYSLTKPLTVTLIMRLIEEGVIGLWDRVQKYIPEFGDVFLLENGVERKSGTAPTVYHLLTMSAGLSYDWEGYGVYEAIENRGEKSPTVAAMSALSRLPLMCEVGTKMNYGLSHDVLGAIAEIATGKKFSRLMSEYILEPLGMDKTRFSGVGEEPVFDIYTAKSDGRIVPSKKTNAFTFSEGYESGGAGLISTVNDYMKFADMLALGGISPDGVRILSEASVREIYTPRFGSVTVGGNYSCIQGEGYGYGLGVRTRMIETQWGLPVGEFGWDGAAGSYLMVDPVNKISVVVGMHLKNWPAVFEGKHLEIVKKIYEDL